MSRLTTLGIASVFTGFLALPAHAEPEFALGMGFSQVRIDGAKGAFEQQDGLRLEPRFSFTPAQDTPEFRLGFALGISMYWHDLDDGRYPVSGGYVIWTSDMTESLTLLEPEVQLSWRHIFAADARDRVWIEPGLGLGGAIANEWLGDPWWGTTSDSDWAATWTVRPFIRAAYTHERWSLGVEGSYLWGGALDLSETTDGDLREWYLGAFFGISW